MNQSNLSSPQSRFHSFMLGAAGIATIWMAVFDVSGYVSFDDWKVYLLPFAIAAVFILARALWTTVLALAVSVPVAVVAGFVWLVAYISDRIMNAYRRRRWKRFNDAVNSLKTA